MKTILLYCALGTVLVLSICAESAKPKPWMNNQDVPGIQFITGEFGIDRTEVTNFHWLEFLYWTGRNYGTQSAHYKNLLPDTTVWTKLDSSYRYMELNYLREPMFRDLPVVGINYEQAKAYCQWRSDRVFEYWLIRTKLWSFAQAIETDSSDHISIERYEKGELEAVKPNPKINRIPHYYLPSEKEWYTAMSYVQEKGSGLSARKLKQLDEGLRESVYKGQPMPSPVWDAKPKDWIFYLDGNVSELLADGKSVIGNNWRSNPVPGEDLTFEHGNSGSVCIGFRCAFKWKEVK